MLRMLLPLLFGLIGTQVLASDFGTYTEEAKARLHEERVKAIISQSVAQRKNYDNARDVASYTPQDEAWANEYKSLMTSEEDVDYLEKSLKL